MAESPELSRKENGDVRLDYTVGGVRKTRLWEPRGKDALETTFSAEGAILLQKTVETGKIEERVSETLSDSGTGNPIVVAYSKIVFDKACPWCTKHDLVRFAEAYRSRGDVPIVPIYFCRACRGRSYHLTDDYLTYLIETNPNMFEVKDVERFQNERDSFVTEIKAYIISSFASKKVKRIT
ncbi:MAG: hypothetical protein KGH94_01245 [Candidatus Micrarchaeota archaeon]|nr:hypothetical protein [Candidatus Micrarchaeota archaeon]